MTAQMHEKLIIDGEEFPLAFCPPLPTDSGGVIEVENEALQKQIKDQEIPRRIFSTACWRRYLGTWEIKGGKLYLNDVTGGYKKLKTEPLFAEWFSGVLRILRGKIIQYIHMGFASVFEKEIHIKIEKGKIVRRQEIDNSSRNFDRDKLVQSNLPGNENRFEGDDM